MTSDQRHLARLLRLERVRAAARHAAAAEAAQAESALAQLTMLATRTADLAAGYGVRCDAADGGDLRQLARFTLGLARIGAATVTDVTRAQAVADRRHAELAAAERRRAVVEDRASQAARRIASGGASPALGTRKGFGTGLV